MTPGQRTPCLGLGSHIQRSGTHRHRKAVNQGRRGKRIRARTVLDATGDRDEAAFRDGAWPYRCRDEIARFGGKRGDDRRAQRLVPDAHFIDFAVESKGTARRIVTPDEHIVGVRQVIYEGRATGRSAAAYLPPSRNNRTVEPSQVPVRWRHWPFQIDAGGTAGESIKPDPVEI